MNVCFRHKEDIRQRILLCCTIRSPLVGCDARSSGIREAASIHLATGRRCCGLAARRECAPAPVVYIGVLGSLSSMPYAQDHGLLGTLSADSANATIKGAICDETALACLSEPDRNVSGEI